MWWNEWWWEKEWNNALCALGFELVLVDAEGHILGRTSF